MVQAYLFKKRGELSIYVCMYVCKKVERLDIEGKRKIGREKL